MKKRIQSLQNSKTIFRQLILLLFMLCMAGCQNEDEKEVIKPTIDSFSPTSGLEGTVVTVNGKKFGNNPHLTLNGQSITLKEASETALVFEVSQSATSGTIAVTREGGGQAVSQDIFKVLHPPTITSFSPNQGPVGTSIKILANNFGNNPIVKIGGIQSAIINTQDDGVNVRVAPGTKSGKITIETDEGKSESVIDFTFQAHLIDKVVSAISSKETDVLGPEQPIIIYGNNFSSLASENVVKINGISLNVNNATSATLRISLPKEISSGKLTVTIGDLIVEYPKPFTIPQGRWTKLNDFPGPDRQALVGFTIGDKGYIGTGQQVGSTSTTNLKDFWEFSNVTNTWTEKASFGGTERSFAIGFGIGNKGYLGGGNNFATDFWEYDPSINQWTKKSDIPSSLTSIAGFSANGKGFICDLNNKIWEYTPGNNQWVQKNPFPGQARQDLVAVPIGSKVYFGMGSPNYEAQYKDFWEYDAVLDQWNQKKDFPGTARSKCIAFAVNGKIYVGGGRTGTSVQSYEYDFWMYDLQTDTWTQSTPLPTENVIGNICFAIGNKGYMGLSGTKSFWEFTP